MPLIRNLIQAVCIASLALITATALATTQPAAPTVSGSQAISKKVVEGRLKEIEASTEYDEVAQSTLIKRYHKTLSSLESMHAHQASTKEYKQASANAPEEIKKLRAQQKQAKEKQAPQTLESLKIRADVQLPDIERLLLKEKANATAVETKLKALENQLDAEDGRPEQARQRLTEASVQLDKINAELKKSKPSEEPAVLNEARRWTLMAQRQALTAEINMIDQELLSQPVRLELLKYQIDTTRISVKRIAERTALLENFLNRQRRTEVEQVIAEAETTPGETADKHPVVQELAKHNIQASEALSKLSERLEQVSSGDQQANEMAKRIEKDFRRTQQKLDIAGLNQALGQVLLEQRRQLPDIRKILKQAQRNEQLIAATTFSRIQTSEELRKLSDLESYVDGLIANLDTTEISDVREDLLVLAENRRTLLQKTATLNNAYLRTLGELDYAQHQLTDVVSRYDAFLSERLLWVRSAPSPNIALLLNTPAQVRNILSPQQWYNVLNTLFVQMISSPYPLMILALFGVLLFKRGAMKRALLETSKLINKPRTDSFRYTLRALGLTLLIAIPWPLLTWALGWVLSNSLDADNFTTSLAHGLMVLSPAFFYLSAFRSLCLPQGLAGAHFRWHDASLQPLRRQLDLLMMTFLPAALVAVIGIHQGSMIEGALGRIAFIAAMASLAWYFYRLLGPRNPVLEAELKRHPDSMLNRFRYLWMVLALLIPLLHVVLAIGGFLYTAMTLTSSLIDTLWLILGFLVIHQLAVRWLLITGRKLSFEAAVEHRKAALAAHQDGGATTTPHDEAESEEDEVDLVALNQDSLKLLNSAILFGAIFGLWFIWSDVLPAFGRLENVTLWHYMGIAEGQESLLPVTLADLLLALLIATITVVTARRFPALLEIVLLKRFPVSSGVRYTSTTLARYIISAVGLLLVLSTVGASWSQVQWLAAALGVGIGFGLQEIVANFISGLIILFERPIRVGDVVTIGDTDGTVTRIHIRATTIRTWDRQELLVPNKEFITGRLLNWSLSDQTTRLRIPVGIAYGGDVQQAMALMRAVAEENPLVLSDPAPYTLFAAFGDNTLNLELRCFVGAQEDRLPAGTQLHEAINEQFNQCGIVIAFPQRDIHLDTSQPLDIRIQRDKA